MDKYEKALVVINNKLSKGSSSEEVSAYLTLKELVDNNSQKDIDELNLVKGEVLDNFPEKRNQV